jgi:hypothetical protein
MSENKLSIRPKDSSITLYEDIETIIPIKKDNFVLLRMNA